MTKLVVEELRTELIHNATAPSRMVVKAVRPFIYKHRSPAGTFKIELWQFGAKLDETSLTSAEIETNAGLNPNEFMHGPINFEFSNGVPINRGTFQIKLTNSGYAFSESAYLAWQRPHENFINDFTDPNNVIQNPLGVELWTYKYDKKT